MQPFSRALTFGIVLALVVPVINLSAQNLEDYALRSAAPQLAAVPQPVPAPQPEQLAPIPKPAAPVLAKFKASGYSAVLETPYLLMDAGTDRSIFAKYGLDPEWITIPGRSITATDLKQLVENGIKIGFSVTSDVVLARANGAPIKIVAGASGLAAGKIFVKADSPIREAQDLNGKKIGVGSTASPLYRQVLYMSDTLAIKPEAVPVGNVTSQIAALKSGGIDSFITAEISPLKLVDSGELRILVNISDILPKPYVSLAVFATDDLIQQNPDFVGRFVKATLETVRGLKDNPSYAGELVIKRTNVPRETADKAAAQIDWTPSGLGSGTDLVKAVANVWQYTRDSGAIPPNTNVKVEEAVDLRWLVSPAGLAPR